MVGVPIGARAPALAAESELAREAVLTWSTTGGRPVDRWAGTSQGAPRRLVEIHNGRSLGVHGQRTETTNRSEFDDPRSCLLLEGTPWERHVLL